MEKTEYVKYVFSLAREQGKCRTQKEFAALLGFNDKYLSSAINGNPRFLTDSLIGRVQAFERSLQTPTTEKLETILVIPTGARAGTLGDFADSVAAYDCERMISPVRGAVCASSE